jgi:hypothetical protein
MYFIQEEIKLNDRCTCVDITDDFFTITDGSHLKIYNLESLNSSIGEPRYTLKNENVIVHSKLQNNSNIGINHSTRNERHGL